MQRMLSRLTAISVLFFLCNTAFSAEPIHVAVGSYTTKEEYHSRLLIGVSQGSSWQLQTLKEEGRLRNASCSDDYCVAIGDVNSEKLVVVSKNHGISWEKIAIEPPNTHGAPQEAHCNHKICVAVGDYYTKYRQLPLLAVKKPQEDNWSYYSISNLPSNIKIELRTVNCTEKSCIVGGFFISEEEKQLPFIAVGTGLDTNQDITWKYTPVPVPEKKLDKADIDIRNVSCNSIVCIAQGDYRKKIQDEEIRFPFVVRSYDHGQSWIDTPIPENHNLPGVTGSYIYKIHCSDAVCLGVGYYYTPHIGSPTLIRSIDNGATWTYPDSIIQGAPKEGIGSLSSVSCINNFCVAGGVYFGEVATQMLWLVVSHDAGATWEYKSPLPEKGTEGMVNGVTCDSNQCIAVGEVSGTGMPYLAISPNQSDTWFFPPVKVESPDPFYGKFHAIDSNTEAGISLKLHQEKTFGMQTSLAKVLVKQPPFSKKV